MPAEEEAQAVKQRLLGEVGKTGLGRALLDYLAKRAIAIVMGDPSQGNTEGGTAAAYWDPQGNRIIIDPNASLAQHLHFFAHEARHAAQGEANLKLPHQIEMMHPFYAVLHLRLQEMDADLFAVHFVNNHAKQIAHDEGAALLAELSTPALPPETFMRGEKEVTVRKIDRSGMYRAFAESGNIDPAASLLAAAKDFIDNRVITRFYAKFSLQGWAQTIPPLLNQFKDEPESYFAAAFREAAQSYENKTPVLPAETLKAAALAYGQIFGEAGMPDYASRIDFEKFIPYLVNESPGAREVQGMKALQDEMMLFRDFGDYYLAKATPAPKNPAIS